MMRKEFTAKPSVVTLKNLIFYLPVAFSDVARIATACPFTNATREMWKKVTMRWWWGWGDINIYNTKEKNDHFSAVLTRWSKDFTAIFKSCSCTYQAPLATLPLFPLHAFSPRLQEKMKRNGCKWWDTKKETAKWYGVTLNDKTHQAFSEMFAVLPLHA